MVMTRAHETFKTLSEGFKRKSLYSIPNMYSNREKFISEYGFPVITDEALNKIVKYTKKTPILEVGSGTSYLTYELKGRGVEVVATDAHDFGVQGYGFTKQWTEHEVLDARSAVLKYPKHNVMLSWPNDFNQDEGWSDDMLDHCNADYLFYIGEGKGGCTGSHRFHDLINGRWGEIVEHVLIPTWPTVSDQLYIVKSIKE